MKALTLWPEWAYSIVHHGKDGENRTWPMPKAMEGSLLAIHAGMRPVLGIRRHTQRSAELDFWHWTCSKSSARATVDWSGLDAMRGRIVAVGTCSRSVLNHYSPWSDGNGSYFTPIRSVISLPHPVACRGAQGLWNVPPDVEAQVREEMARATRTQR